MTTKRLLVGALLLVLILAVAYVAYSKLSETYFTDNSAQKNSAEELIKAPDFTVYDEDGNAVSLSEFFGKPIVVNFWASWCGPCKIEMPDFDEAYSEIGDDTVFMMINMVDGRRETQQTGRDYIKSKGYSFPVYYDIELKASLSYGITSYPTTIFIDDEGYIVSGYLGAINKQVILDTVEELLSKGH